MPTGVPDVWVVRAAGASLSRPPTFIRGSWRRGRDRYAAEAQDDRRVWRQAARRVEPVGLAARGLRGRADELPGHQERVPRIMQAGLDSGALRLHQEAGGLDPGRAVDVQHDRLARR